MGGEIFLTAWDGKDLGLENTPTLAIRQVPTTIALIARIPKMM